MSAPKMPDGRIKLGVRTLKLEKEIAQMKLPRDVEEAARLTLQMRNDELEARYNKTLRFIHLQSLGDFCTVFGCKSTQEWLAQNDLSCGSALASQEILVRLFDKQTFMTVGDVMLDDMTFLVSKHQSDSELRKRDYQAIFDTYLKSNDTFDKVEFRKILYWYVNTTYKPEGRDTKDNTARPPRAEPKGWASQKKPRPNESEASAAELPNDFEVETRPCACGWREYALELENIIRSELGAKRLPARPKELS
jgi:hypothetical protein